MVKIGDTIKIIHLADEPYDSNYKGKKGVVTKIEIDPWGDERIGGTWGGIYIYTYLDQFEIIREGN